MGIALPDRVVTNSELASRLNTTDEWILDRVGIRERRVGGSTVELATRAACRALETAGTPAASVEVLILATTTPEAIVPSTASMVHRRLGLARDCGAFDLNAACAGFVYGLVAAYSLLQVGYRRALVIGADALSTITDPDDRATAALLADGAGAVVVDGSGEFESALLGWDMGTEGSASDLLYCAHGDYLRMRGSEVFRRAVIAGSESSMRALRAAGVSPCEIAMLVPHQANRRIIGAIADRLGIDDDHTSVVLDRTGNTSAGSIPLALDHALLRGVVHRGDRILLTGFGAGMTWASAVLRW